MSFLKGKTALVTGGSGGIGSAISVAMAHRGLSRLAVNYLQNEAAAEEIARRIREAGTDCRLVRADLRYSDRTDAMFEEIRQEWGCIDIFVHAAAFGAFKPLIQTKPNQWEITMAVCARAFLYCVQKCLPLMSQGLIVAISSTGSQRAVPSYGAHGPSKAALEATVRQLAWELAPRGIRVNAVSSSLVETDSIRGSPYYDEWLRRIEQKSPAGRAGLPEDVAETVMLLLQPEAAWIQGQILLADGGISLA